MSNKQMEEFKAKIADHVKKHPQPITHKDLQTKDAPIIPTAIDEPAPQLDPIIPEVVTPIVEAEDESLDD